MQQAYVTSLAPLIPFLCDILYKISSKILDDFYLNILIGNRQVI